MTGQLISFLTAVIGAIVGSTIGVLGAIWIFKKSTNELELVEIRRQKVECLVNIAGLRFVLSMGQPRREEYASKLMFELNKIPILWSDDVATLSMLRDFNADRTNDRLFKLIRSLGETTKFPMQNLIDADIRTTSIV
jgi:hypothetical protein